MNSQKTIWRNLKWLFLPVALCFWLVGGLFVNTAKAEFDTDILNISDGYITIPEYENNAELICGTSRFAGDIITPTFNGVEMTQIGTSTTLYVDGSSDPINIGVFHYSNPDIGSYLTTRGSNNYGYLTILQCIIVKGIEEIIDTEHSFTSYPNGETGNYFLHYFFANPSGIDTTYISSPVATTTKIAGGGDRYPETAYSYKEIESSLEQPDYDYNVSGYEDAINTTNVFKMDGWFIEFSLYGVEEPPVNIYTDVITPTPQINYRPMLEDTYQIFRYTYNTSKIPNNIFGGLAYIESELCLNEGCSSTSPMIFDNGIATSTKAYMFTGTGEISTTTSQYGSSFFNIKTPTDRIGTTTAAQERYKITPYYFRAATLETIRANPVVWVVNYSPQILENPTPTTATSTFASIFGASPHDLACSETEWESIATTTPWYEFSFFDFTRLKCNGFETGLVFVEYAINIPVAIINGTLNTIGNIFPFGLITKIIEQWNLAKTETMPDDLVWLSPVNQEGDLTIDIPGTWTNSTTTEKVAIFGDTLFKSTYPTLTAFFEGIRALSTYGIWFGLIMLIWVRGKDTYNEIMADKTEKKHEDENWQY